MAESDLRGLSDEALVHFELASEREDWDRIEIRSLPLPAKHGYLD